MARDELLSPEAEPEEVEAEEGHEHHDHHLQDPAEIGTHLAKYQGTDADGCNDGCNGAGKSGILLPRRQTLDPLRTRNGGDPPPDRLDEGNDHPDDDEYLDDRPGVLERSDVEDNVEDDPEPEGPRGTE